jgi:hypothetical protein
MGDISGQDLIEFGYGISAFRTPEGKTLKTRNKELPALLEELASTPQKRGSETKGGVPERGVLMKLNVRGVH